MNDDQPIRDYAPEIRALLVALQSAGYTLRAVDNGDGDVPITSLDQAVGEADACDECTLRVTFPDGVRKASILIVLGNSPGELAADWTAKDNAALDEIGRVIGEVSAQWEGTPQRMTTWPERRARGY